MNKIDLAPIMEKVDQIIANGPYKDNWDSLSTHPVPEWFRKAKFGIFIHYGVYSVPAFSNEWYPRAMYIQGTPEFEHHRKTYGDQKDFGYKDFIPMFKAENLVAEDWAKLFKESGAKYVVPVAEHHDGFQMYKSELSHFNVVEMGPKRDIYGDLSKAFAKEGLVSCASTHRAEHWFFMGHGKEFDSDIKEPLERGDFYWPAMPEAELHDINSKPTPSEEYLQDWLARTVELIDKYQPNLLYFDWWIQHVAFKPYLKKVAAYYYNRAVEWGKEVLINYKHDAFLFGTAVVEIERGQFADIKPYYWQSDTAVAKNSWCYTEGNDYKSVSEILCDLIDVVSKNGNMLLNIGPRADGTIPEEDTNILKGIGAWLAVNGEAIYDTHVYRTFGEGPTEVTEGQFSDGTKKEFTSADFRFTMKGENLYAIALKPSTDDTYCIKTLAEQDASSKPVFHGVIKEVAQLASGEKCDFYRDSMGLHIKAKNDIAGSLTNDNAKSNSKEDQNPVVFKITIE